MPRNKDGKKDDPINQEDLALAVEQIAKGELTFYRAAKNYNLSKTTLIRQVKKFKNSGNQTFHYHHNRDKKKVFNEAEELQLVEYIETAAYLHYGLTLKDIRVLAYEYAKANTKSYDKSWDENGMAGEFWLRLFRSKYSDRISLRKPEATSLARATAFNKTNVATFFENFTKAVQKVPNLVAQNIWNCDETGLSTVHVPNKVMAKKGVKQLGSMTNAERGSNITMIAAINAGGGFIPPMLIFPRVNFRDHMIKGAPVGSIGGANPSGWSNEELFIKYLLHFIKHSNASIVNPVILLLDNHESHISIAALRTAKDNGVIMVTFHPHTSHKMQPLDVGVFGPFKTFYNRAMKDWMCRPGNVAKPATIYDIPELVNRAFTLAFTPTNILAGFRATGIEPLNTDIFSDVDFLSSSVTDRPLEEPSTDAATELLASSTSSSQVSASIIAAPSTSGTQTLPLLIVDNATSSSGSTIAPSSSHSPALKNSEPSVISLKKFSPENIRPFPKAAPRKVTRKGRPKGKSCILTDTPEKTRIEAEKAARLKKRQISVKHRPMKKQRKKSHRKLIFSSSDSDLDDPDEIMSNSGKEEEGLQESDGKIEKGSFVLVQISTKKTVKYFVGEITGVHEDYFKLIYLKKLEDSSKFIRADETAYEVDKVDVLLKLPPPILGGGSARQLTNLQFGVDLTKFNVQ